MRVVVSWRVAHPVAPVGDQEDEGDEAPGDGVGPVLSLEVRSGRPKLVMRTPPSTPWAMRVSSELREAWLNSHAYQKVTATVVTKPIGWVAKTPMTNSGACQPLMASAMTAVAPSRDRVRCNSGCAYPGSAPP